MIEIIIMVIAGIALDAGLMMVDCKIYQKQKEVNFDRQYWWDNWDSFPSLRGGDFFLL